MRVAFCLAFVRGWFPRSVLNWIVRGGGILFSLLHTKMCNTRALFSDGSFFLIGPPPQSSVSVVEGVGDDALYR